MKTSLPWSVTDSQPEHCCFAEMTLADLVLILQVMPDDVEGGVILKSKVEVLMMRVSRTSSSSMKPAAATPVLNRQS